MENEKKKKMMSLRISEKTVEEVKAKRGENSPEFVFLMVLKQANVPYSVIANMLNMDQGHIRDCITARKQYPDEAQKIMVTEKFRRLLENAMDLGLLPCSDVAVVEPILRCTLAVMALGNK